MRQVLAIVAAALLAGLGAVVLGEYPLQGTTAIVGFPLYGVAVAELALAIARRLVPAAVAAAAALVGGGLAWALWISFGHFRNDGRPPALSWVMVAVAVLTAAAWARPRRRLSGGAKPASSGGTGEPAGTGGQGPPAGSGGRGEPAGSGGRGEPAGSGGKKSPAGTGGKGESAGTGDKGPPAGSEGTKEPAPGTEAAS